MSKRIVISEEPDLSLYVRMKGLGELVRFKRTSMDLTIENASSLCRVSKQALSNMEKGLESVKVETLFKVLDGLGIHLSFDQSRPATKEANDEWL